MDQDQEPQTPQHRKRSKALTLPTSRGLSFVRAATQMTCAEPDSPRLSGTNCRREFVAAPCVLAEWPLATHFILCARAQGRPQGDGVTPNDSPKSLRSARPEHPPVSGLVRVLSCCCYPPLVWRPNLMGDEIILALARSHPETDDHQARRMIGAGV